MPVKEAHGRHHVTPPKVMQNIFYPYQHLWGLCLSTKPDRSSWPHPRENHGRRYRQDQEPSEDKGGPEALNFYGSSLEVSLVFPPMKKKNGKQDRKV